MAEQQILLFGLLRLYDSVFFVTRKHKYDKLIYDLKQEHQHQTENLISLQNNINELKICDDNVKEFVTSHISLMQKMLEACYQAPKNVLGKEIKQIVQFQDKNKANWEKLYPYIDLQYNDIMKTTKHNYPQLNERDLLLLALTCMGYSCAQIAIIMGYSNATTIGGNRLRLARKMNLKSSLIDYISTFKSDGQK